MKRRANDPSKKCLFEYSDLIFKKVRKNFRIFFKKKFLQKKIENFDLSKMGSKWSKCQIWVKMSNLGQNGQNVKFTF